jgi:hypothetical protein
MENDTPKTLAEALCRAQASMGGAKRTQTNPYFKSRYADMESVLQAIKQPFADNGLFVTQPLDMLDDGKMVLVTKIVHSSGESLTSRMPIPAIADVQKLGSYITYCRRYALMSIAGLAPEDDDGNQARSVAKLDSGQVATIRQSINGSKRVAGLLLKRYPSGAASIPAEDYDRVMSMINEELSKDEASDE